MLDPAAGSLPQAHPPLPPQRRPRPRLTGPAGPLVPLLQAPSLPLRHPSSAPAGPSGGLPPSLGPPARPPARPRPTVLTATRAVARLGLLHYLLLPGPAPLDSDHRSHEPLQAPLLPAHGPALARAPPASGGKEVPRPALPRHHPPSLLLPPRFLLHCSTLSPWLQPFARRRRAD